MSGSTYSTVIIRPKRPFIQWVNWAFTLSGDREYSAVYFKKNCSVILIPKCLYEKEARAYIHENWDAIFEEVLRGWHISESLWPRDRTREMFGQWFGMEFHSRMFQLK